MNILDHLDALNDTITDASSVLEAIQAVEQYCSLHHLDADGFVVHYGFNADGMTVGIAE